MGSNNSSETKPGVCQELTMSVLNKIIDSSINGVGPFESAYVLSEKYKSYNYKSTKEMCKSMIKWETLKAFNSGFLCNLGGLITLPITIPTNITANMLLQTRLAAAIAVSYGLDVRDERIRQIILFSLLGNSAQSVVKDFAIQVGVKSFKNIFASNIPYASFIKISEKIGLKILAAFNQQGFKLFTKAIPIVGGVIGGSLDGIKSVAVGNAAIYFCEDAKKENY